MATCRYIVNSALRKIGRLAAGREPRVADQTDTLAALQGLYGAWIAAGTFGRMTDVAPTGTTYTSSGNERIIRSSEAEMSVTLPEFISEASYSDYGVPRRGYYGTVITVTENAGQVVVDVQASQPIGCVEPPRDGAPVMITDRDGGQTRAWIYDGTLKAWQRVDDLQLDDQAPRSGADQEGLAATLAMEVADVFGAEIGAATLRQANRFQAAMTHRYGMRREPVSGVYC